MCVTVLDELSAGIPTTSTPEVERAFGTSHAYFTALVFLVPGAVALVLEPIVFVLSDRYPRKHFVRGALAVMGVASGVAACADGPIVLTAALSAWAVATGTAGALAQAMVVERAPGRRSQTLARWTLMSTLGDLAAPALVALAPWRTAFVVAGALCLTWAAVLALRDLDPPRGAAAASPAEPDEPEPEPEPLWRALRDAVRDGRLVAWLLATALCDLLDEIVLVFAAIRMTEAGVDGTHRALAIGAFVLGGAVGLVALERILARVGEARARRVLLAAALACAATYALWLAVPAAATFALVGATAAPLYPLVAAQAYARRPDRAGLVLAASHLFTPLGLALPFLLGAIADRAGTFVALVLLLAQPLGIAWIVVSDASRARD